MCVTKKPYSRVIFFFRRKSCKPAYTTYSKKKKLHDLTVFLLRTFTAKKKDYTTYSKKKKLHDLTVFLLRAFTAKKKVALPTCGPLLILPPALKRWGSPIRHG